MKAAKLAIPVLADTTERVRWLARIMSEGRYSPTVREAIAERWGLSGHRTGELASEASRLLRVDPAELDALREQHAQWCDRIRAEALETRSNVTGMPDFRAALEANRDAARFRGIDIDTPLVSVNSGLAIHVTKEVARAFAPAHRDDHEQPEVVHALPHGGAS